MPSKVRGLLLINAEGQRYFIEGGIAADRVGSGVPFGTTSEADVVAFQPIDPSKIKSFEDGCRADWFAGRPQEANLGPFILQAYSVVLERDDNGNDSAVTGNAGQIGRP